MKRCSSEAGYEVVATHDRVPTRSVTLDREKVDLILTDVRLSGDGTGIDLAQDRQATRHPGAVRHRHRARRGGQTWRSAA